MDEEAIKKDFEEGEDFELTEEEKREFWNRITPWSALTNEGADLLLKELKRLNDVFVELNIKPEDVFRPNIVRAIRRDMGRAIMRKANIPGVP